MKTMRMWPAGVVLLWLGVGATPGAEWYVATDGSDAAAGTNWPTAKLTIHAGVDAAAAGDTVWVSNGVYATGGGSGAGTHFNRVAINRSVAVRSVNGAGDTMIVGGGMRCAYVTNGAVLSGFTLTNGTALRGPDGVDNDYHAGGALCEDNGVLANCVLTGNLGDRGGGSYGGRLSNCIVTGNRATAGGGSCVGTLNNCRLSDNSVPAWGGGASDCILNNCVVTGNRASEGGGASGGVLNNCTVVSNSAAGRGGILYTMANNCIVYDNVATGYGNEANYYDCSFTNSCTTPDPGGTGNITNDPQFVDAAAGNYRLRTNSPCLDAGNDAYVQGATDLAGDPRIALVRVDLGAYEVQSLDGFADWAGGITNGLTNATDCAAGDGVPNLLKYATGSPDPMAPDDLARLGWEQNGGGPTLVFNRNPNATDVSLVVEGAEAMIDGAAWRGLATNLNGSWGGASNVRENETGNPVVCTVEDPVPLVSNRFLRLKVTRP